MQDLKTLITDFGCVNKGDVLAFQRSPLSQWYGAYKGQDGGFWNNGNFLNCTEQFMMVSKALLFKDKESARKILNQPDPKKQKNLGREVKGFKQEVWDKHKYKLVLRGNFLKFSQNYNCRLFLLSTGDLTLVEAAPWDKIWGCGTGFDDPRTYDPKEWQGENLLGKALQQTRELLKQIT